MIIANWTILEREINKLSFPVIPDSVLIMRRQQRAHKVNKVQNAFDNLFILKHAPVPKAADTLERLTPRVETFFGLKTKEDLQQN